MPSRRTATRTMPSQGQLLLPMLDALADAGGQASVQEVAASLAATFGLTPDVTDARVSGGQRHGGTVNAWHRHVRWVQERAKALGFTTSTATRGTWAITDAGRDGLRTATPGVVITVYETPNGQALWARCEDAMRCMAGGETHLIFTSPPYGLAHSKNYETRSADENVRWLLECAVEWKRLLTDDGTLMLNVGPAWQKGAGPVQSIWRQELVVGLVRELGFHFAQTLYWVNNAKLPGPAAHVTVKTVRLTESTEEVFCFVMDQRRSRWDSRRLPRVPYSNAMRQKLAQGGERTSRRRPSGHVVRAGTFSADLGGSMPRNVLTIPNTSSRGPYRDHCTALGIPAHAATMPASLAEFAITLSTEPGDRVGDPFGGSLQTAAACERLGRQWWSSEQSLTYLAGAGGRFTETPGFIDHLGLSHR